MSSLLFFIFAALVPSLVFSTFSQAATQNACDFKPLLFKHAKKKQWKFTDRNLTALLEGAEPDGIAFAGPLKLKIKGKKTFCTFAESLIASVSYLPSKKLALVGVLNGTGGMHFVINADTCKKVGLQAFYDGSAKLANGRLVNEPPCQFNSKDTRVALCSTGKVFDFDLNSCALSLNEKESRVFTKKILGVELNFDRSYKVKYPYTAGVSLIKEKI